MESRDSILSTESIKSAVVSMLGVALLLLGAPDMSNAQTNGSPSFDQQNPVSWGLRAGLSAGDLWGDDVGSTSMRTGFTGGVYMTYRIHPAFSVQPELLYTTRNSETSSAIGPTEVVTEYDFSYIEIPVLLKGQLPMQTLSPYVYAGPNLAFNLSAEANGSDISDNVNSTDVGLSFGAGIDIYRNINFDVRYTLGMTNTFDVTGDPDAKTAVWNFTLGYSL